MDKLNQKGKIGGYDIIKDYFKLNDGTQAFFQAYIIDHSFKKNLVIHHGLGEHSGRYGNLIDSLSELNVNIFSFDARGHGQTKTKQAQIKDVDQLVDDLGCFLKMIEENYKVKKPIIYGHSMGGVVVLSFILKNTNQWHFNGVIASAPALIANLDIVQKIKQKIGNLLGEIFPKLVLPTGLLVKFITHDSIELRKYKEDPLVHDKISMSFGSSFLKSGQIILSKADLINIPILILHGQDDGLVDYKGSQTLFSKVSSTDKQILIYENLYHEIHNETEFERKRVLADINTWVEKHL